MLLTELSDPNYWIEGCFRVIMYCVRTKHLRFDFFLSYVELVCIDVVFFHLLMFILHCIWVSAAIDLFKQLKGMFEGDELVIETLFDSVGSGSLLIEFI